MAFDIVGFDSTKKVPRFAALLVFGAGVISAGSLSLACLCVGMKTTAGSMVADNDVVPITSYADADTYAGPGSQLARMLYKALDQQTNCPLFAAACAEPTGTQATALIGISGVWNTNGQIGISLAGETVVIGVGSTDTPQNVSDNIVAAVAGKYRWPATALDATSTTQTGTAATLTFSGGIVTATGLGSSLSSIYVGGTITITGANTTANNNTFTILSVPASGSVTYANAGGATDSDNGSIGWTTAIKTVTLTCRNKGVQGKDWILFVDNSLAPTGMTLTVTGSSTVGSNYRVRFGATSSGTGVENVTNILTKLQSARYARIAVAQNDVTNLPLWQSDVDTLAEPNTLILEQFVFASSASLATAYGLTGTTLNEPRANGLWYRNSESHPSEVAAAFAALRAGTEVNGLVPDYDFTAGNGILLNVAPVRAGYESDKPLDSESEIALSNGLTPVTSSGSDVGTIRAITTYCHLSSTALPAGGGTADYRTIDVGDVVVADFVALDLQLKWQTSFRVSNPYVGDNPAQGSPPAPSGVATPDDWTAFVANQLTGYFQALQIEDPTLNPPQSVYNSTALRIQSEVTIVVRRIQHQIGVIVRQQQTS